MKRQLFLDHYSCHRGCPGQSCERFQVELKEATRGKVQLSPPPALEPKPFIDWVKRWGRAYLHQEDIYLHERDDLQTIAIKVMFYRLGIDSPTHPFYVAVKAQTSPDLQETAA